ncbi:hypothetical protein BD779DRAFT_1494950 [Infundibulicybe gibba]|nr:hypothetical protein BD779DRAFT_1494950 [Infundibulicybe gibba]
MAQSASPTMSDIPHRPPSVSVASAISLTRRSRTRARSRTLTGGQPARSENVPTSPTSELPYLESAFLRDPSPSSPLDSPSSTSLQAPQASSPLRDTQTSPENDHTLIANPVADTSDMKRSKVARKASHLPDIATSTPPSAFSRVPLTGLDGTGVNVRDSILTQNSLSTQQSGTSSSLYPPSTSTSTASEVESPTSPRSMADQYESYNVQSYAPDVEEVQEYDGDDVAYRLRLLVKNNYFLPPAHSKPSPSDFATSTLNPPKRPARSTTPTFLDLFRVGKSRSKPPTPTTQKPDTLLPMLRTTSDSTIMSGYGVRQQPRSSSQIPRVSTHPGNHPRERVGRVVVVREKMNDLSIAAKQAEQEMKTRVRRDQSSQKMGLDTFDNVIDPTDAVDLPPPSSQYPFAVQASVLHGLGVQDSVGAALLADHLPPPTSPGMSSSYDTEEDWRKALLHEAVHHSLDTSPDISSFSMILGASTPLATPRVSKTTTRGESPGPKRLLEQKIVNKPLNEDPTPPQPKRKKSTQSMGTTASRPHTSGGFAHLKSPASYASSRPSSYLPLRVETPSGPMTPLTPPPRKHFGRHPLSSSSSAGARPPTLRKAISSPLLSEAYEASVRQEFVMTPPPLPPFTNHSQNSQDFLASSWETSRGDQQLVVAESDSHYTDDEDGDVDRKPRTSYSQPSPTTSAFQDTLNRGGYQSGSSSFHQRQDHSSASGDGSSPRYSTMSPPPRMSSSLAHVALSPPPHYPSFRPHISPTPTRPSTPQPDPLPEIFAPEPTTPPFPISERRGNPQTTPLALRIPPTNIPVAIHSAPGPSSPTSFFDSIQAQPNAMDDLESSSDESDCEEEGQDELRPETNLFVDQRTRAISQMTSLHTRPPIMRLGNHSTPYVTRPKIPRQSEDRRPSLPFGMKDPKQPIGHIPARAPFFTERLAKGGYGHGPPPTLDFIKHTQQASGPSTNLASTHKPTAVDQGQSSGAPNANQRAQESLKKLDGMLIQHMETEKDTIKRIATTVHSNLKS